MTPMGWLRTDLEKNLRQPPVLMAVGAVLMLVALPLPWAEAQAIDRSAHVTGTEAVVPLVWTVVIAVLLLACWAARSVRHSVSLGLLALAGAISASAFAGASILVTQRLDGILATALGESTVNAGPGIGLWTLLVGGLLGGIGSSSSALRAATAAAESRTPFAAHPPAPPRPTPPPIERPGPPPGAEVQGDPT